MASLLDQLVYEDGEPAFRHQNVMARRRFDGKMFWRRDILVQFFWSCNFWRQETLTFEWGGACFIYILYRIGKYANFLYYRCRFFWKLYLGRTSSIRYCAGELLITMSPVRVLYTPNVFSMLIRAYVLSCYNISMKQNLLEENLLTQE